MTKRSGLWVAAVAVAGLAVAALWVSGVGRRQAMVYAGPSAPLPEAAVEPGLRVHVFETGSMKIPGWSVWVGGSGERAMDQPAYLIEHPRFGRVMFEAGHHSGIAADPGDHLGWIHAAGLMPMEQSPGQSAKDQLNAAGIDPASVRAIIASHFHPEHVGAVEEFPEAEVVTDRRELEHARADPDYNYVPREYDEVKRWRPLDFEGAPAFGTFAGSVDLFGDGSVYVVSSPGHTPGHVSMALRLASGWLFLAGDAAWTEQNLDSASIGLPWVSNDGPAARASLGQLLRFRAENPQVVIVPGHDLAPLRRAARPEVIFHPWPAAGAALASPPPA